MKNLIIMLFLVISNSLFSQSISITVAGNWMNNISPSDISEAGNDYPVAHTSNVNQTLLTINPTSNGKTIYVYVTRSDIAWHINLILKIKRTSNGTNNNTSISSGGLSYQIVTNAQSPVTPLFACIGTFINIPFQYELTGISVLLPVQSYSTTIMYTVMH